jgi:hypothetical protein
MTFIEDMRTRLLGEKRVLGNIRSSVGAISDAIAYNLDDGIYRPSAVPNHSPTPVEALRADQVRQRSVVLLTMTALVDQRI